MKKNLKSKWKGIPRPCFGSCNIAEVHLSSNSSLDLMQFSKNSYKTLVDIHRLILKFLLKSKGSRTGKRVLKKKNKTGRITFSEEQKAMWYWKRVDI